MKIAITAAIIASTTLMFSCKKNDNNNSTPSASNITPGQCTISFDTDKDFAGTKSVKISPSVTTAAGKTTNGSKDQMTLTAAAYSGTTVSSASLSVFVSTGATTANGAINGNFNSSGSMNELAVLTISRTSVGGQTASYASKTGTFTITKLTTTELEGSFSCNAVNESENTSINVSNGKFAAKFK